MKLKWKRLVFAAGILMLLSCKAPAADVIRVNLNGHAVAFDVEPQMIHDRTMVPVRAVFEAMGAEVSWDSELLTAKAVKDSDVVEMTVDREEMIVNGSSIPMDAPPVIIRDRILVSARYAAEGFGYSVDWDGLSKLVTISDTDLLTARFFDVGQADSELVTLPDGKVMLIDAGGDIRAYLQALGIRRIDYLAATHPHSDHIAYLDEVIREYDIGTVYMPQVNHTTKDYENLLEAVKEKNLPVYAAKAGMDIASEEEYAIHILSPAAEQYQELNNYSAVIKIEYGDCAMLFMGDAQAEAESRITGDVSAQVLKVGHHGAKTSTSESFFQRVNPSYGVISCGASNSYGHPNAEILKRLEGIGVYRTDRDGHITMIADNAGVNGVYTEKGGEKSERKASVFYRTKTGNKYHIEGCKSLTKSKISVSQEEIKAMGLTPCGICIKE